MSLRFHTGSGLEDINGVFEESNTYQPSVPSSEAEIIVMFYFITCFVKIFLICRIRFQILQENFRGVEKDLHQEFIIDNTLGRDVKFTLDESGSGNSDRITRIKLLYANGTEFYTTRKEGGISSPAYLKLMMQQSNCLLLPTIARPFHTIPYQHPDPRQRPEGQS